MEDCLVWGKNVTYLVTRSVRRSVFCSSSKEKLTGGNNYRFPPIWVGLIVAEPHSSSLLSIHPSIHLHHHWIMVKQMMRIAWGSGSWWVPGKSFLLRSCVNQMKCKMHLELLLFVNRYIKKTIKQRLGSLNLQFINKFSHKIIDLQDGKGPRALCPPGRL